MSNAANSNLRQWLSMLLVGCLVCFCTGCSLFSFTSSPPAQKEQTRLDLSIEAAAGLNPDSQGRASPILLRVYELRSDIVFQDADYFSLQNADKTTLGGDLLVVDQFILRPGETRTIRRKSNPETSSIGVFAGYRDLPNATWRAVYKMSAAPEQGWQRIVMPANKADLRIDLQANAILLTDRESGRRPVNQAGEQSQKGVMDQLNSAKQSMDDASKSLPKVPDTSGLSNAVKNPLGSLGNLFKP